MDRINADNQDLILKKRIGILFGKMKEHINDGFCPVQDFMMGTLDKWSLFVMYSLGYYEVMRFNELKAAIRNISPRMLSSTLKKLESHGIVSREGLCRSATEGRISPDHFRTIMG